MDLGRARGERVQRVVDARQLLVVHADALGGQGRRLRRLGRDGHHRLPWNRTRSSASTGWNAGRASAVASAIRPGSAMRIAFRGTSACVSTATTPGTAAAAVVSMATTRAEA